MLKRSFCILKPENHTFLNMSDQSYFQAKDLIKFVLKNWKTFLIVGVVAVVLSIIFSSSTFIRPKYKSIATVYATTTPSVSAALTVEDNPYRKNVLEFGEEENAEQLIQILRSDMIKEVIIKEFELGKHYWLDPNHEKYEAWLDNLYRKHITFKKNSYLAVEINVVDYDAQRAADIANRIVELIDEVILKIKTDRAKEALVIMEEYARKVQAEMDSINREATSYFGEGYISADQQSQKLSEQLGIAIRNNNKRAEGKIREELKKLGKYAAQIYQFEHRAMYLNRNLEITRKQLHNIQIDNLKPMTNKFVINKAKPAYKKHYPIRSLIVIGAALLAFVITLTVLYFKENIHEFKS
jgi:uncharacterized protein involved in exopolysaccharide biosynthesis